MSVPGGAGLARRQIAVTPWRALRSGSGDASTVARDLKTLLLDDVERAGRAYAALENVVESQGHLFECAPAVVAVIAAAISDGTVPAANLAPTLDLLGRVLAGHAAPSETALGNTRVREECHASAMQAYWPLVRLALLDDEFHAQDVARDIVLALDEAAARAVLEEGGGPG